MCFILILSWKTWRPQGPTQKSQKNRFWGAFGTHLFLVDPSGAGLGPRQHLPLTPRRAHPVGQCGRGGAAGFPGSEPAAVRSARGGRLSGAAHHLGRAAGRADASHPRPRSSGTAAGWHVCPMCHHPNTLRRMRCTAIAEELRKQ